MKISACGCLISWTRVVERRPRGRWFPLAGGLQAAIEFLVSADSAERWTRECRRRAIYRRGRVRRCSGASDAARARGAMGPCHVGYKYALLWGPEWPGGTDGLSRSGRLPITWLDFSRQAARGLSMQYGGGSARISASRLRSRRANQWHERRADRWRSNARRLSCDSIICPVASSLRRPALNVS
jgi:hypothetical protein